MTPRRTSAFPARLVIYGPCLCQPHRMDLVVSSRWIPFVATLMAGNGRALNPFALVLDISTMNTEPTTE